MATESRNTHTSDTAILSRLIRPDDDNLPPSAAEAWLAIRFEQTDLDRMHELAVRIRKTSSRPRTRPSWRITAASVFCWT
jgi:hypothetical protein